MFRHYAPEEKVSLKNGKSYKNIKTATFFFRERRP